MEFFKVKPKRISYSDLSRIPSDYTEKMNREYNWMAKGYDVFMAVFPLWKKWIKKVIPHIQGNRILEVSFGTGYLMTKYAAPDQQLFGIDYNSKMLEISQKKMEKLNIVANLSKGNVEALPYEDNSFDTVINTMAFTGYPDGEKALSELRRVLKPDGKLLLVDFDFPANRNVFGYLFVRLWEKFGDIIKDMNALMTKYGFDYDVLPVGGFGSVQLFIARKK